MSLDIMSEKGLESGIALNEFQSHIMFSLPLFAERSSMISGPQDVPAPNSRVSALKASAEILALNS